LSLWTGVHGLRESGRILIIIENVDVDGLARSRRSHRHGTNRNGHRNGVRNGHRNSRNRHGHRHRAASTAHDGQARNALASGGDTRHSVAANRVTRHRSQRRLAALHIITRWASGRNALTDGQGDGDDLVTSEHVTAVINNSPGTGDDGVTRAQSLIRLLTAHIIVSGSDGTSASIRGLRATSVGGIGRLVTADQSITREVAESRSDGVGNLNGTRGRSLVTATIHSSEGDGLRTRALFRSSGEAVAPSDGRASISSTSTTIVVQVALNVTTVAERVALEGGGGSRVGDSGRLAITNGEGSSAGSNLTARISGTEGHGGRGTASVGNQVREVVGELHVGTVARISDHSVGVGTQPSLNLLKVVGSVALDSLVLSGGDESGRSGITNGESGSAGSSVTTVSGGEDHTLDTTSNGTSSRGVVGDDQVGSASVSDGGSTDSVDEVAVSSHVAGAVALNHDTLRSGVEGRSNTINNGEGAGSGGERPQASVTVKVTRSLSQPAGASSKELVQVRVELEHTSVARAPPLLAM